MSKFTLLTTAIDALATYRATKLIIDDEITADLRDRAFSYLTDHPGPVSQKLTYFLTCPWCVSIWAAGGITALRLISPEAANAFSTVLASSAVTGLLYTNL